MLQPGVLAFTLKLFISIDWLLCKVARQPLAWQDDAVAAHQGVSASVRAVADIRSSEEPQWSKARLFYLCCFIHLVFQPPCRYSKRVERVFFQERDLRVGGHKRHAALPLRLPFRYHIDRDDLRRSQRGPSHDFKAIHIVCVLLSNTGAALLFPGHTLRWVMWFRVSAEGRREFAHHTDPNQISLSYRGRTR